ncbi:MAG TPA: mechanosensitive ion channel domain-containing protein [Verrucomicrobiae bacterium]|jgi:small-conductance mechanosensitive channel|nr:mechanosensitive ion channel domain-containing protein [Verrucomicrobiae bacterium]
MAQWWTDILASQGGIALAAFGVVVLTILVVEIVRFISRVAARKISRKTAAGPASDAATGWSLFVTETVPPLVLFIWVWSLTSIAFLLLRYLFHTTDFKTTVHWVRHLGVAAAFFWMLFRLVSVVEFLLLRWAARSAQKWDDVIAAVVVRGLRLLVPLLGVIIVVPTLDIPERYHQFIREGTSVLVAGAVGFILYELVNTGEAAVAQQFRIDTGDNLSQRKVVTQIKMLKRIAVALIGLFTLASMLMVFEPVRHLATSMLASAGVAGIVIGFAAQRSLGTLVAGIQIAFTQPIRIDDVVIVEGEWGRIEEITMTYVVVVIWDLRRLVLPITYFIEKPFQNWTRVSADLLGTVFLYLDYSTPLAPLRAELDRLLGASKLWDGKVKGVQVTDSKEQTIEIRILVSAADASKQFDLRCDIREKLIDFLQRNFPHALPRHRLDFPPGAGPSGAAVAPS